MSLQILLIILVFIVLFFVIMLFPKWKSDLDGIIKYDTPQKRAGREGEIIGTEIIKKALWDDDLLFTNVQISYDDKEAELDNVIVNKYGVFIIEVKNYKGALYGDEEDFDWLKVKDDGYGNEFHKVVKNPIKQVKRQIFIFAKYLKYYGIDVWVKGYALFIHDNCPVDSECVLYDIDDISKAIHTFDRSRLDTRTIQNIKELLG